MRNSKFLFARIALVWLLALAIFPTLVSAQAIDGSVHGPRVTSATIAVSLTTTQAGEVVAGVFAQSNVTSVVGSTLGAFTAVAQGGAGTERAEFWAIHSTGALTSETITVTQTSGFDIAVDAFGVSGDNQTSFVMDAGGPVTGTSDPLSITTVNTNTMVLAIYTGVQFTASPTAGSGFTVVPNSGTNNMITEFKVLSSTAATSCTMTNGAGLAAAGAVIAIVKTSNAVTPHLKSLMGVGL